MFLPIVHQKVKFTFTLRFRNLALKKKEMLPDNRDVNVLLVGEADCSFAHALLQMGYRNLVVTIYDDERTVSK